MPTETTLTFADLALREEILKAVAESGYTLPTPIQAQAIPAILARRDVVGIAQTGTGKTAAFVLPMIELLSAGRARARMPRSLILSPTRELATQTSDNFEKYGKHLKLTMALLIGGVGMGDQEKALERGVDVLIATPGRLLDWFERGKVMLGGVDILVIDEADRMLDMGFIPDIEKIVDIVKRRQQTLLFSATMPKEVRRLAEAFLTDPVEIAVTRPATMLAAVEDFLAMVPHTRKLRALRALLAEQSVDKAIVFCNRKRDVSSLNRQLQKAGLNARDIHGDLEQRHRQATLDAFKRGEVDYLIATDVAARGLDIEDMPCVINYDVPLHAEDYVHRIGRTGRAGRKGRAFTFAGPDDDRYVGAITRLTGRAITPLSIGGVSTAAAEEDAPPAEPRRTRRRRSGEAPAEAAPAETPPAEPRAPRRRSRARPQPVEAPAEAAPAPEAVAAPTPEASPETATPVAKPPGRRRTMRRKDVAAKAPEAADSAPELPFETASPAPVEVAPAPSEPTSPEPVTADAAGAVAAPDSEGGETPAAVADAAATPEPRRRGRRRGRAEASPPAPARPASVKPKPSPVSAPGLGEQPAMHATRPRGGEGPVVGLGDHVPAFLLRPVPLKHLDKPGEE